METRTLKPTRRYGTRLLVIAASLAWLPLAGNAADAHRAVRAAPGEMVMLRDVPTRPADRPAPPGMALMVSPSPRPEVAAALGTGELSDDDYARLDATPSSARAPSTTVGRALDGALVRSTGGTAPVAGNGVSNTIATPMGAVGDATRGIGDQVQGALAQFSLGTGH
ncbi:MAG TPA: hypothetical protein VGU03_10270 [Frateuria sp.]|uniref:hypothetical protein n=1 Tax=Frateuria sp. TaxID=2211372 RepID=UPI002DE9F2DA|nr:hypothetical protein [Frateuria sp.]